MHGHTNVKYLLRITFKYFPYHLGPNFFSLHISYASIFLFWTEDQFQFPEVSLIGFIAECEIITEAVK